MAKKGPKELPFPYILYEMKLHTQLTQLPAGQQ